MRESNDKAIQESKCVVSSEGGGDFDQCSCSCSCGDSGGSREVRIEIAGRNDGPVYIASPIKQARVFLRDALRNEGQL